MKVSVCIATYNGQKYIRQQLESILYQLSADDEVIISDNGSSDLTREVINSIGDARVTVYSFNVRSVVSNFENALKNASGDIIVIADQDDVWLYRKIDTIRRELINFDLIVTDCIVVDEHLRVLNNSLFELRKPKVGVFNNLIRNSYTGCCMAFNRKVLGAALPFPKNLPMHDWWIGVVGEVVGTVKFIHQPLILYRRHSFNASTLTNPSKYSLLKQFSMRLNLFINLFKRFVLKI